MTLPNFTDEQYAAMAEEAVYRGVLELGGAAQLAAVVRAVVGIGTHDARAALGRCVSQGRLRRTHFDTYVDAALVAARDAEGS